MNNNRLGKYLLYALGEIFLVVIGILIALSLNNWNQKRIDRINIVQFLTNIKKEIHFNQNINRGLISNRWTKKIEGLKLAKRFSENNFEIIDTTDFLAKITYGGVASGGMEFGTRKFYDELLASGNFQMIDNDTLKNTMSNYYARIELDRTRIAIYSTEFVNFTNGLRPFDPYNPEEFSAFDKIEMIKAFKTDSFRNLVDQELSYAYKAKQYIQNQNEGGDRTIELIQEELSKN